MGGNINLDMSKRNIDNTFVQIFHFDQNLFDVAYFSVRRGLLNGVFEIKENILNGG